MNQPFIGHKSYVHSSLAGKRKLSPPKKTLVALTPQPRQGTSRADGTTQMSDSRTGIETSQDPIQISSGSSSSLNLNSWDGIKDNYFDDMTNHNLPPSHQFESNQGLNVPGTADSPHLRLNLSVNADQRAIIEVPDSAEVEGSEGNPILLDSASDAVAQPNAHPRHARLRRNVGSPTFFADLLI